MRACKNIFNIYLFSVGNISSKMAAPRLRDSIIFVPCEYEHVHVWSRIVKRTSGADCSRVGIVRLDDTSFTDLLPHLQGFWPSSAGFCL